MIRTTHRRNMGGIVLGAGLTLALGACGGMNAPGMTPPMADMAGPAPMGQPGIAFSGARPDADNQSVLDALPKLGIRPYHTLEPKAVRNQPTFSDGVQKVLLDAGRPTAPPPGVNVRDITIRGAAGPLPAKVYTPAGVQGPLPVIVYFHGGGWVIANPMVYDASGRALAREAQAVVLSVEYRKAPEHKFPAQHDDALASYRWALANAASIGGDPRRVALAGESAGGGLAVATAMQARDQGLQRPVHVLSVYPIAGADLNTPSYQENANAGPLNRAAMAWFFHHTVRTPADLMDPRINLVGADLRGFPPVTIVQAQIDPLRSEGDMLAERLRAAGVDVAEREWAGATHEFFGADAVIADARSAQAFAGERLRAAFGMR